MDKTKGKDPAFLFYSKDWLEGTAEMLPEEKGIYIDLLCHQHQKGSIPADETRLARMVGLSLEDFKKHWAILLPKFNRTDDRLVNRKLTRLVDERAQLGHKNKILSAYAILLRQSDLSDSDKKKIKKRFRIDDFIPFSTEEATERLTEWFNRTMNRTEDVYENGIGNEDGNILLTKYSTVLQFSSTISSKLKQKNLSDISKMREGFIKRHPGENSEQEADEQLSKDCQAYEKLMRWIKNKAPRVHQLQEQLSINEFVELTTKITDKNLIVEKLTAMQNKKDLLTKYTSTYLTLLNWAKQSNHA